MNENNQNNLENGVIDYVNNWIAHGAPPQKYEVFSRLTWPMPAPCIELWCLLQRDNNLYLWCTQRESTDTVWPDEWHSIGSVAMLSDFFGPETEHMISKVSFLQELFDKAKEDPMRYNLSDPKKRILQRILRKDSGIKDEDFILSLLDKPIFLCTYYCLTPRGAEMNEFMAMDCNGFEDKFYGGKWINIQEIPKLINEGKFVEIQGPKIPIMLEFWSKSKQK